MKPAATLDYRAVSRDDLAEHLGAHEVLSAEVCAGVTVYRCRDADAAGITLAIALPDGSGLVIAPPSAARLLDRRRKPG